MFNEKLERTTDVMQNMNLKDDIQSQIKYYFEYTDNHLQNQNEMNEFFSVLSPSLRKLVMTNMFKESIMKNVVFGKDEKNVTLLCEKLDIKVCVPEQKVVNQNDSAESMFFISKGQLDVYLTDELNQSTLTNSLSSGSYFGEVALLKKCKRTATVTSRNYGTLAELKQDDFEVMMKYNPTIKSMMNEHIHKEYNDRWRKFMHRSLRNIDYFATGVANRVINELSYQFEYISLEQGRYLFQAGDICDSIHVVCSGELEIYLNSNMEESYLDTLYTGCTIGGNGCLTSELYTNSARAKSDCLIMKLNIDKVRKMRKSHSSLNLMMREYERYIEDTKPPV